MADNSFWTGLTHNFLEVFGFIVLLLHSLHFLIKHARPTLEEARELYLYVKSWKTGEQRQALPESQPKT